jgi:hypothetical protein
MLAAVLIQGGDVPAIFILEGILQIMVGLIIVSDMWVFVRV